MTTLAHPAHDQHDERAERWRIIRERSTRGLLTLNSGGVHEVEPGLFAVPSSRGGYHRVRVDPAACSCEDWQHFGSLRDVSCRHIVAAALSIAARRSGVKVRTISAAGDPIQARGNRRLHELRDIVRHELDEETRERARDELLRLTRRQLR